MNNNSYPKEPEKLDVCLLKAHIRGEIVQKGSHSILCQDINVLVALKSTQKCKDFALTEITSLPH